LKSEEEEEWQQQPATTISNTVKRYDS